jgi:hypothetical protein
MVNCSRIAAQTLTHKLPQSRWLDEDREAKNSVLFSMRNTYATLELLGATEMHTLYKQIGSAAVIFF